MYELDSANIKLHTQAGEDCDRTKESWNVAQQAVVLQETAVNQSHSLTPDLLKVCTPTEKQPVGFLM